MDTMNSIWTGRIAYQIMPDRFYRKGENPEMINGRKLKAWNDRMPDWQPDYDGEYRNLYYYGGNLEGIEEKLSYIHDLGFDIIYLTPIEQSVSYHHYDVGNHLVIDPWLGTWDSFKSLCRKAQELNILVVVDLVFNHTGINSSYFDNEKYQEWYKRDQQGNPVFWWGFKDLPECNTLSKSYQEAMTKVVEKYLENGASGIRLDLGENLPESFLRAIGRVKEKYPETIFIGEMWGLATDKSDSKIFNGELDSVMNYPMADAILRWTRYGYNQHFEYNFNRVYGEYPKSVQDILLNNIGTHDTPNSITMLVGDKMNPDVFNNRIWDIEGAWRSENQFDTYGFRQYEAEHDELPEKSIVHGKLLLKIALAIMYTIPVISCVFQGTEVADSGYKDPFNRKPYPWNKQEEEMKDFIKRLGAYRKNNTDILATGKAEILRITDSILVLERKSESGRLVLCVNRTDKAQSINFNFYNPKVVFQENNNSINRLEPFGIIVIRN